MKKKSGKVEFHNKKLIETDKKQNITQLKEQHNVNKQMQTQNKTNLQSKLIIIKKKDQSQTVSK